MANIRLRISNINNNAYPQLILRKFFHMIFVSSDGKKLNIYTAVVFGGITPGKVLPDSGGTSVQIPCTDYDLNHDCSLKFEYEGSDNCIKRIDYKDLTRSLWGQTECLTQVWGSFDKYKTQDEVNQLFQKVYANASLNGSMGMDGEWPVYYIHEDGKANHECIVSNGCFEKSGEGVKRAFTLKSNKNKQREGMEFMNWVKTEILLSASILNKHVIFEISLDQGKAHTYFTPDFTWYFAPPSGYCVVEETAAVKLGQQGIRNLVQRVAGDTTVHFTQWEKDEQIDDRLKARVNVSSQIVGNPRILSENGRIRVELSIVNPRQPENKQFFIGLLTAFLLSFCADKTRLNDYYACIQKICSCGTNLCKCEQLCNVLSFLFPILAIAAYMSLMFTTKRCVPANKKRRLFFWRFIKAFGLILTAAGMLYVFFAWPVFPEHMESLIKNCALNRWISIGVPVLGGVLNLAYVVYCIFIRKKKLFDYI